MKASGGFCFSPLFVTFFCCATPDVSFPYKLFYSYAVVSIVSTEGDM